MIGLLLEVCDCSNRLRFTKFHSLLLGQKFLRFTRGTSIGRVFTLLPFIEVPRTFVVPPIDPEVDVKSVSKVREKIFVDNVQLSVVQKKR